MSVITTGFESSSTKDLFKKVLFELFDTTDRDHPKEWKEVYNDFKTKDDFERKTQVAGLEAASEMAEGEAIPYSSPVRGNDKTYTPVQYGISFRVTDRMKRVEKWGLVEKWTRSAKEMQNYTKEVVAAQLWNDPTGATYTHKGFDTLDFAENSHTGLLAGSTADNYDNLASADLSYAAIQAAERYFDQMVDDMGHIMPLTPDKLVVPTELRHIANEIYKSDKKHGEMSNTASYLDKGVDVFVYHFLTSSTGWYMLAKNSRYYDVNMFTLAEPDKEWVPAYDNTRDSIFSSIQYFVGSFGDARTVYAGNT